MRKILKPKYLTMVSFLVLLAVMCLLGISSVCAGAKKTALYFLNTGKLNISFIEDTYSEEFIGKYEFISANGAFHRLIGARVVNDRYRMDNGYLTSISDKFDLDWHMENTVSFRDALQERDIPFVYVNTPYKIHKTDKQLPAGVEDYSNENTDFALSYLRKHNIPVLDLRECIASEGLDHYSMFYKTDHHWTAEAGFWATGKVTDFLAQQDSSFAVEESLLDASNFNFDVYEDVFLGSAGIRVGEIYAGLDDMTVISPKFDTRFTFTVESEDIHREGSFADTFLFMDLLTTDNMLQSDSYALYCRGCHDLLKIQNYGTGYAPKKILMLIDSFSNVVIPFMSLGYEQTHVIDLRKFEGDLMAYVDDYDPDAVVILYNPGAYGERSMFSFIK